MCPREEVFISVVKKIGKGKTNKVRRDFRRAIKDAKRDGSYTALVNEVVDDLVQRGLACPSLLSTPPD